MMIYYDYDDKLKIIMEGTFTIASNKILWPEHSPVRSYTRNVSSLTRDLVVFDRLKEGK